MKISLFFGKRETEVARADEVLATNWEDLPSRITQYAWAPGIYRENHRKNINLETMDLFVCDVDGGCTIEQAKEIFKPFKCIIGLSKSHQKWKDEKPPCDRFRVVVPLTEPITNDADFKATWFSVQKFCPAIDPQCKDAARFYWPCTDIVAQWDGALIQTIKYVAPEPKPEPLVAPTGNNLDLSKRTYKFRAEGAAEGQWHGELVAACLDMKQQRWSREDAARWLSNITDQGLDAHDTDTIEDIWANREPRHAPRVNQNEAFKKLVSKCNLIMDTRKDSGDYCFLDRATGEQHDIDTLRASEIIGKKYWPDYLNANKLEAEFTFNPRLPAFTTTARENTLIYNTYKPATWRHREYWFNESVPKLDKMPELYERYFDHITGGYKESKEYLLDWIANSLRERNFTILTAIGIQGAGKGMLAEGILKHLHGETNFQYCRDEIFKNKFNAQLKNKTIVNVDEISLKTKEEHDKLKGIVNDTIELEAKGKDATNAQNFASFYITSNYLDAIEIEAGDRRYSIIQLSNKKILDTDLRAHIKTICKPEMVYELGRYLWYRPITHDMFAPFKSERYEEVKRHGLKTWELWFTEEFCEMHKGKRHPLKFVINEIKDETEILVGRPGLEKLSKKYPELFKVIQNPDKRGERLVEIAPFRAAPESKPAPVTS